MAVLSISKQLHKKISTKSERIGVYFQSEIDNFVYKDEDFLLIHRSVKKILESDFFVVLRNIGFSRNKSVFESFVKLFGRYYGVIEHTGINLVCKYTGCNYNALTLHNDDAIDLNNPKYTFIQVLSEDPNGKDFGWNGVVKIDDVVEYLKIHDTDLLDKLFNYDFPMLSFGVSAYSDSREEIILKLPILSYSNKQIKVRFDLSRIKHFYYKKEISMPREEIIILDKFLRVCHLFRKRYFLSKGDILIVDNHRTLHDREEASIEIGINGELVSREIFVSFVYEQ